MERLTEHSKQTSHENGICCTHFRGRAQRAADRKRREQVSRGGGGREER